MLIEFAPTLHSSGEEDAGELPEAVIKRTLVSHSYTLLSAALGPKLCHQKGNAARSVAMAANCDAGTFN